MSRSRTVRTTAALPFACGGGFGCDGQQHANGENHVYQLLHALLVRIEWKKSQLIFAEFLMVRFTAAFDLG